tara:strand:- start:196 stop:357 length:162 start_codon:yes stop_codon:yes gene_type:complete
MIKKAEYSYRKRAISMAAVSSFFVDLESLDVKVLSALLYIGNILRLEDISLLE